MPSFDTRYERSAHHSSSKVRLRVFLVVAISILPNSCTSARLRPRSRAQLKNAINSCVKTLPKCACSIAGWDVSKVKDMSGMFQGATSFNGDISKWEVSGVSSMKNMFRDAGSFKRSLCGADWVHSNALKTGMFVGSAGSIPREVCASNRLTSREVCTRTQPSEIKGISIPKELSSEQFNIPRFKPSDENLKREVIEYLYRYPEGICFDCPQGAIGEWDVSRVTDMSDLFLDAERFVGDISKWNVSGVTNMKNMFMGASSFNGDLSRWDVSRVEDMTNMFTDAKAFQGDISKWDVSNVKNMTDMFSGAQAFNSYDCLKEHETPSVLKYRILIGGGSGFVGTALTKALRNRNHDVTIISRTPQIGDLSWEDIKRDGLPESVDAVINLAGSDIMDFKKLWTCKYKEECVSSRVDTTALLAKAISESDNPPSVWISTSATGFYPPSKENEYDEGSRLDPKEADWAWKLCTDVEHAAKISDPEARTRSVIMRLGIVLGQGGGPFEKMRLPFYCCLGGTFGDGSQWFPYVHLKDVVRAFEFAVLDDRARGPLNVVAPSACTNKEFTKALGRAMRRPTFLSVPKFVYSLLGEERSSLLLTGRHVKPNALTLMGFEFNFPDVTSCCADLVSKKN